MTDAPQEPTRTETAAAAAPAPDQTVVARIRQEIQLDDRARIATFGDRAQRAVTSYAEKVLQKTRNKELGDTGRLLTDIILRAKKLDPAAMEKEGFLSRMFGGAKAQIEKFRARFDDVAAQIDEIALQLQKRRDELLRDVAMLDNLHEETKASIADLEAYIAAGRAFAEEFRATELPALKARAEAAAAEPGGGLMEAQAYNDAEQALDRLEKRVFYLVQARQIGIQQLPQIRIVQASDETLSEQLQASTRLTIPLWKQKMVLLLGLNRQREALELQKTVTDATNDMLRQASDMMKDQALEIEQASHRGVVDLETLEKTNADLIETLEGVARIQEEGRAQRAVVEARLAELGGELRQALTDARVSE